MYDQHPSSAGNAPARTPGIAIASLVLGFGGFLLLFLGSVLVYSFGPNGANDAGQGDDVTSW